MTTTNHRRVAIWAAVSSKPQAAEDKVSLDDQERKGREYAERIGGTVVRVYKVPGHSRDFTFWDEAAAAMPAYRQLREDAETGNFDDLWVLDPDRLGRDSALATQVASLIKKNGQRLWVEDGQYYVSKEAGAGGYMFAFQSRRGEEMQDKRTSRHAMGMRARIERGLPACHWPHGYCAVRDDKGKTIGGEFVPGEIEAVEMVTRLYLDGTGYDAIAQRLNASPYRPRKARRWATSSVRGIIGNDFYAGYVTFGDFRNSEPSDCYPPAWDEATYAEIVRARSRRHQGGNPPASPVSSVVYCKRCEHPMTSTRIIWHTGAPYRIFRCTTHLRKHLSGRGCHPNRIYEDDVLAALQGYLEYLAATPGTARAIAEREGRPSRTGLEVEVAEAEKWIAEIERKQDRISNAVGAGALDNASAARVTRQLDDEMADAKAARDGAVARLAALPDAAELQRSLGQVLVLRDLREVPLELVRQRLLQAGFRVWCEEGRIVEIERGVFA